MQPKFAKLGRRMMSDEIGGIVLTYQLAMAAGQDAGNRAMRAAGRSAWSDEDFDAACAEMDRLVEHIVSEPRQL